MISSRNCDQLKEYVVTPMSGSVAVVRDRDIDKPKMIVRHDHNHHNWINHGVTNMPQLAGPEGAGETLDQRYKVKPASFFTIGKVFARRDRRARISSPFRSQSSAQYVRWRGIFSQDERPWKQHHAQAKAAATEDEPR